MAIAKVSLNNLLLIAILASSSVNAASQDIKRYKLRLAKVISRPALSLANILRTLKALSKIWVKR